MSDKQKTILKVSLIVLAAIGLLVGGFFAGRASVKETVKTVVEYVELPAIHDTIVNLEPYEVRVPADTVNIIKKCVEDGIYSELFPNKIITDTLYITKKDTAAILIDWATERLYSETLFDIDTVGKCIVNAKVQYNRIDTLGYEFTPIQKTITNEIVRVKWVSPFVGMGVDWTMKNANYAGHLNFDAQAGMFFKEKVGLSAIYRYDFMMQTHSVGGLIMYKF